jgi:hypothetical protein
MSRKVLATAIYIVDPNDRNDYSHGDDNEDDKIFITLKLRYGTVRYSRYRALDHMDHIQTLSCALRVPLFNRQLTLLFPCRLILGKDSVYLSKVEKMVTRWRGTDSTGESATRWAMLSRPHLFFLVQQANVR